jgi:hypothetical protein
MLNPEYRVIVEMARNSGMSQSIISRMLTSQELTELTALKEIELKESNIYDRYFNGIMNQISACFGGSNQFIDYTDAWKAEPKTNLEQRQENELKYKALAQ